MNQETIDQRARVREAGKDSYWNNAKAIPSMCKVFVNETNNPEEGNDMTGLLAEWMAGRTDEQARMIYLDVELNTLMDTKMLDYHLMPKKGLEEVVDRINGIVEGHITITIQKKQVKYKDLTENKVFKGKPIKELILEAIYQFINAKYAGQIENAKRIAEQGEK